MKIKVVFYWFSKCFHLNFVCSSGCFVVYSFRFLNLRLTVFCQPNSQECLINQSIWPLNQSNWKSFYHFALNNENTCWQIFDTVVVLLSNDISDVVSYRHLISEKVFIKEQLKSETLLFQATKTKQVFWFFFQFYLSKINSVFAVSPTGGKKSSVCQKTWFVS